MTTPLRVLIVGDSPDDAELVALRLAEEGFRPEWRRVESEPDYLAALGTPPDLILADWSLPQFSGVRALQLARERDLDIPFVIVSGSIGEEAAVDAVRQGAYDYVLKDRPARLGQAVMHALEEKRMRDEKREAEQALRESERRLREAQALGLIGNWEFDVDSQTIAWSDQAYRLYERDPALGPPTVGEEAAYYAPEQAERLREYARRAIEEGQEFAYDLQAKLPSGKLAHFSTTMRPIEDESGRVIRLFGTVQDITERKQAEAHITHLNEVLRAVRNVNQLITRERDPQRLMAEACAILVRTRSYRLAWIGSIEEGHRRVVPAARAGQGADYLDQVTITWDESETGQGPTGTAIRTRQPAECRNMTIDPRYAPWREAALARGFGSSAAVPMVYGERLFGTVTVYADRPEAFDGEEIGLLSELAGDMAFALQSAEDEAERKRAEEALRESEEAERRFQERLRTLIEVGNELSRADSVDALCRRAVELGRARLGFDRLGILFRSPDPDFIVGSRGTDEYGNLSDERGIRSVVDDGQREIFVQTQPITLRWDDVDLVNGNGNVVGRGARAQAAMWDGEQAIGFVSTDNLLQRQPITDHDCELLNLYASTLGYLCSRKQAEEELAAERTLLRTIVDILPALVYAKDTACRKFLSNHVDLEYMGASTEAEVLGKTDFDFYPEDMAARFYARDQAIIQTGQPLIDYEHTIVTVDGQQRWLLTSKVPLQDSAGQVIGLVGVGQDITERKQAEVALQRYVERLRILRTIDGVVLAAQSPQDIGQAVLRHLQRLVPSDRVLISSFDLENEKATVLASLAGDATWLEAGTQVELEALGGIENLQAGKVSVVGDAQALEGTSPGQPGSLFEGARSYLHIPLIAQGELVGSLLLVSEHPAAFTTEHVEVAGELSGQLAIGIHQARLREQIQRHAEELEQQVAARTAQLTRRTTQLRVAAEVARDATLAHDLDELLNRSVGLIRDRFGFYHAGIFLTDERGEYAVLRSAPGDAGRRMLEHGHRLQVGKVGIVGHVCASGEPRIALDAGADAVHFNNPFLPDTHSEMALPMRVGGNIIGALDVQSTEESAFDQDDVEILQVMADQLAVAIERTRLFEQAQATLEERLHTVISKVPIVLFALDRQGVFTLSEGKGLEALGLKPGEHVGRSSLDLYRDAPEVLEDCRRALAGEVVTSIREQAGSTFEAWYSPLRDESGEIIGVMGVAIDITERRRLEAQMQRQERLAAVGQLAGGIAHDFNNFLMTIIFYAHLLLRGKDVSPDIISIAETIVGEANRAAALVRQVLDFSRRSAMETRPVDLASFVAEVMDILQKTLPENIRVVTEVESDDYTVEIDPTRIQQVIMNLALNSRDAMPDGGDLHIGLSRMAVGPEGMGLPGISGLELAAGDWVRLSVQDTGVGMDERVRAHLFEPFFTTKGPKGNGLGLAQVYGIIQQHGGHIDVDTAPGQGTMFRLYLPIYHAEEEVVRGPEKKPVTVEGQGETILFVEDEERVREAGRRVLESLGYRVLIASDGREALRMYQAAERARLEQGLGIDLVLTDMVMPEMGGKALIEELQRMNPRVKILALTGYTMQEDLPVLRKEGFVDMVYKPLDVDALGKAIRRLLDADTGNE